MFFSLNIYKHKGKRRCRCRRHPRTSLLVRLYLPLLALWIRDAAAAVTNVANDIVLGGSNERATSTSTATITDGGAFSETGNSFSQDFCGMYERMILNKSGIDNISQALKGTELQVFVNSGKFFIYDKETGLNSDYPGVHARILDYIAEKGGFNWRNSFGVWTEEEKGDRSFTELLRWGTEKYDMMIGAYTPSTERMRDGVSFAKGHFDGSLVLVRNIQTPRLKIDWFNWTKPFEPIVWAGLIAVVFLSSFAYQLVEALGAKGGRHENKSVRVWLMENMYLSFINFTGNYSYEPDTLGGRVFGFCFAFWAMLITAAYTANLASILMGQVKPDLRINGIEDVIDHRLRLCVHKTSFSDHFFRMKYPQLVPYLVPVEKDAMYDSVNKGVCEVLVASKQDFQTSLRQEDANPMCTMRWEGQMVKMLEDSFATKHDPGVLCTDLVREVFSYYITEMQDDGTLQKFWEEHDSFYATRGHCETSNTDEEATGRRRLAETGAGSENSNASVSEPDMEEMEDDSDSLALSLEDLAGTLIFQVIGSAISIVVALLSNLEPKTKKRRQRRREVARRQSTLEHRDNPSIKSDEKRLPRSSQKEEREQELHRRIDALTEMLQQVVRDRGQYS